MIIKSSAVLPLITLLSSNVGEVNAAIRKGVKGSDSNRELQVADMTDMNFKGGRKSRDVYTKIIEVTNLAYQQPFSPFFVMSTCPDYDVPPLYTLGEPPSEGLAILAENGDPGPLIEYYSGMEGVFHAGAFDEGAPYFVGNGPFNISVPFTEDCNMITVATMAINTNDCFVALNARPLARGDRLIRVPGLDAGSEVNNEECDSIPGPGCPMDSGNERSGDGEGVVHVHRGFQGIGDLPKAGYDWRNPMAMFSVVDVVEDDDYYDYYGDVDDRRKFRVLQGAPLEDDEIDDGAPAEADDRDHRGGSSDDEPVEYLKVIEVTILSFLQPLSPLFIMSTCSDDVPPVYELGQPASEALAILAENGDPGPLVEYYSGMEGVYYAGAVMDGAPFTVAEGPFNISIPFIEGCNRFSMATMAINTNDCFLGFNMLPLRRDDALLRLPGLDAGSEENNEECDSIPGPACPEDSGNERSGNGEGVVHVHRGIHGIGDISAARYDWRNPMLMISPVDVVLAPPPPPPVYEKIIEVTNLAYSQPFGPIFIMSHTRRAPPLYTLGRPPSEALAILAENGDPGPLVEYYSGMPGVCYAGAVMDGVPFTVGEGPFNISIPFEERCGLFTAATMAINTNDCFVAINGLPLTREDRQIRVPGLDAGSEENNEDCDSVPGPACPDTENERSGNGEGVVHVHRGVHGVGDLTESVYDWRNPMAMFSVQDVVLVEP